MAKLYSSKKNEIKNLLPKKETVQLILQYSKALKVIQLGNVKCELIVN